MICDCKCENEIHFTTRRHHHDVDENQESKTKWESEWKEEKWKKNSYFHLSPHQNPSNSSETMLHRYNIFYRVYVCCVVD